MCLNDTDESKVTLRNLLYIRVCVVVDYLLGMFLRGVAFTSEKYMYHLAGI